MALTVLKNANVLDLDLGELVPARTVIVENGTIREVGDGAGSPSSDSQVLDLRGRTLLPGLIDAHVHVTAFTADFGTLARSSPAYVTAQSARILNRMLLRGFTTVRDVGGADFGLSKAVEEGLFPGPRLLFGGKALSQTGGHGDLRGPGHEAYDAAYTQPGLGVICDGVPEVRKAARAEIRRGANHIKIMGGGGAASPTDRLDSDQFSEEEIKAVVEEAEMANLYTVVHAYSGRTIERAARLGVRSIEHGNYLDEETAKLLKQRGCFLVPTLITYQMSSRHGAKLGMAAESVAKINALISSGIKAVEIAKRHGIPMAYGTDLVGAELHEAQLDEFVLRSEVLSPLELLRSATTVAAELVRLDGRIGRVAAGYCADLIVVEGNPLHDIRVMTRPEQNLRLVMKAGQIVKNDLG
ncbi:amidohydrolase family protein [Bosea sp. LjRoot9]|uniref:metal-dependent hydrolase family protein n=1 Tax=Bosea sp. LjRoot9 TaxID=3342341 RepID=UPI003ECC1B00